MNRTLSMALGALLLAACAGLQRSAPHTLSLEVAGFVQAEGITWLEWPNRVQGALEGFPGILGVAFDVEAERFDISYDSSRTSPEAISKIVRDLGFEPREVSGERDSDGPQATVALGSLPKEFKELFESARSADKPVLLDFTTPGWIACHKMDTVTYPHETVQNELGSWVERKVDVTEWREVASLFEVTAVPIAVLVSADGTVLGRISNFVQPKEFADALSNARAEK